MAAGDAMPLAQCVGPDECWFNFPAEPPFDAGVAHLRRGEWVADTSTPSGVPFEYVIARSPADIWARAGQSLLHFDGATWATIVADARSVRFQRDAVGDANAWIVDGALLLSRATTSGEAGLEIVEVTSAGERVLTRLDETTPGVGRQWRYGDLVPLARDDIRWVYPSPRLNPRPSADPIVARFDGTGWRAITIARPSEQGTIVAVKSSDFLFVDWALDQESTQPTRVYRLEQSRWTLDREYGERLAPLIVDRTLWLQGRDKIVRWEPTATRSVPYTVPSCGWVFGSVGSSQLWMLSSADPTSGEVFIASPEGCRPFSRRIRRPRSLTVVTAADGSERAWSLSSSSSGGRTASTATIGARRTPGDWSEFEHQFTDDGRERPSLVFYGPDFGRAFVYSGGAARFNGRAWTDLVVPSLPRETQWFDACDFDADSGLVSTGAGILLRRGSTLTMDRAQGAQSIVCLPDGRAFASSDALIHRESNGQWSEVSLSRPGSHHYRRALRGELIALDSLSVAQQTGPSRRRLLDQGQIEAERPELRGANLTGTFSAYAANDIHMFAAVSSSGPSLPLLHFNGTTIDHVTDVPRSGAYYVAAIGPDDALVAGETLSSLTRVRGGVTSRVAIEGAAGNSVVKGLYANLDRAWVVVHDGARAGAYTLHNGAWSRETSFDAAPTSASNIKIHAIDATNVWAVSPPFGAWRFDGVSWSQVRLSVADEQFVEVWASEAADVWLQTEAGQWYRGNATAGFRRFDTMLCPYAPYGTSANDFWCGPAHWDGRSFSDQSLVAFEGAGPARLAFDGDQLAVGLGRDTIATRRPDGYWQRTTVSSEQYGRLFPSFPRAEPNNARWKSGLFSFSRAESP